MDKLSQLSVAWHGIVPEFESRIRNWRPGVLGGELQYRDHLYARFLEVVPEGCVVQKEYRHFGTTIDIWVKWLGIFRNDEIGFELKLNLKQKAEFDRLIGQIEHMEPGNTNIVVVLIGKMDERFLMALRHKYSSELEEGQMAIVHVPVNA